MAQKAYRVRNWKEYNEALVKRGSITFWFDQESVKNWHEQPKGKRGRPVKYSNIAILCGLTLKSIFHLSFRAVEGFIASLVQALKLEIEIPDYTLLCKRQKSLELPKKSVKKGENIHIVVDTTGIKVFGEGEWKVRQHGYTKHRIWRKLHLAVNSETQEVESFKLTDMSARDFEGFEGLVKKIGNKLKTAIGDGAYDCLSCYELAMKNNFELITPPQRDARTSKERGDQIKKAKRIFLKKRDEAILGVRELGKAEWKVKVGYHRRSLAETAMFRIKKLFGNSFNTRTFEHQQVEAGIWCYAINKMNTLGMPNTIAID